MTATDSAPEYRRLDGRGTNPTHPERGAAPGLMARGPEGADYADGLRRPMDRGNERTISRRLVSIGPDLTQRVRPDVNVLSVLFGQFLNHDLEDNHFFGHWEDNNKSFVTPDSPYQFVWVLDPDDPIATFRGQNRLLDGAPCGIPFKPSTGKVDDGVFRPGNLNTSYLDLNQVYGPEAELAASLREGVGGRLKADDYTGTSLYRTEFGPVNVDYDVRNLPASRATTNAFVDTSFTRLKPEEVVTAGDPRASENAGLLQFQVLFFREHNARADRLAAEHPEWDDQTLFEEARRRTIAVWQHLLLDEWVPTVFGPDMVERIGPYRGFDPDVDPTTSVVFATLALRYGHSALHPYAPRHPDGTVSTMQGIQSVPEDGSLPNVGQVNNGISPMGHYAIAGGTPEHILRGMMATQANTVGVVYSEAIHDIAFVSGGTDLLTLDLARGRDNGLPPYHVIRTTYGGFGDEGAWDSDAEVDNITETQKRALIDAGKKLERRSGLEYFLRFCCVDPENPTDDEHVVATIIREIYRRADSIDPIVGLLAEPHVDGSMVGRTMQNIIADQLRRSRDADRFWYENDQFSDDELAEIKETTVRDLLVRHFDLDGVPSEAFRPMTFDGVPTSEVIAYEAVLDNGQTAFVHARAGTDALPLVALIHGSHVHPRHYSRYATALAAEGFVVVAPEEIREFMGSTAHYPQQAFVNWVLDWAHAQNERSESPLHGRIDTGRLFVAGHSMGGGTTLGIVSDSDQRGLVVDEWSRPDELIAAVVHGTHNIPPPRTGDPLPIDNRVPLAFMQGSNDGVVTRDQAERTFHAVTGVKPHLFVEFAEATHFFVTDDSRPDGANADKSGAQALDQQVSIASAAKWTALWFRANDGDAEALAELRRGADDREPHLRVVLVED